MAFYPCPHCGQHHDSTLTLCPNTGRSITPGAPPSRPSAPPPPPAPGERVRVVPPSDEEMTSTGASRLLGRVIAGRYRVRSVLGEGGMGTVFDGEHVTLGRSVAIKVLHPLQARRSVAVQRFQIEARAAGTIGHPNICEVYDMGQLEDGSPFLVMERLSGETLADRLEREGALSVPEIVDVMMQVLSGLHAAHEKGILHRDIKPENIFLNGRIGLAPIAKILDFGVAKDTTVERPEDLELTMTGMVMGTPFYLSPEQARGDRDLDRRTDVYACGVVLYEALTGTRPFAGDNYNQLLRSILLAEPTPLRDLRPDLPDGFEHVVARAMARHRSARYANALDLQDELAPYHAGAAVVPSGRLSSPPAPSRRSVPPPAPSSGAGPEWDDNTVYDAELAARVSAHASQPPSQRHPGAARVDELTFDEETVRTNQPSQIAKEIREQLKRGKKP
ncbi:MAG: serine/threonine-protein kinase [Polyangiaceae bacterium]